jgi:FixJ family two-component response regulator
MPAGPMTELAPLIHIIDDDASLRAALTRLLTASGYRAVAHASPLDFIASKVADEPGCILLDVDMPELNGMVFQQQLAASGNALPVVFLTGSGNIAMSVRAIKAGAEDFLSKPVNKDDLLEAIGRAVQRHADAHLQHTHLADLRARVDSLTAREREVFILVVQGRLNKQIAFDLGNTERTVKAHRHSIMEKMAVKSLAELVQIASQLGLVEDKA